MPTENFKSVYCTTPDVFLNSKCLFVEFMDVISIPWFNILRFAATSENMRDVYHFTEFNPTDFSECLEWYVNRIDRNIFNSLSTKSHVSEKFNSKLLKTLEDIDEVIFLSAPRLAVDKVINTLIRNEKGEIITKPIVDKIIIYSENENASIKKYIDKVYGKAPYLSYSYGNIGDVLKNVPQDTTYVISNIDNLLALKEHKKLEYSSILMAGNYRYNYNDNLKIKYDIESIRKENVFKFDLFDAFAGAEL